MKHLLSFLSTCAAVLAMVGAAEAACYHKQGDWSETLRDTNGSNLLWMHKGKSREFFLHHVGTGLPDLIACKVGSEELDNCLYVKFRNRKIILSGVTYVQGCKK